MGKQTVNAIWTAEKASVNQSIKKILRNKKKYFHNEGIEQWQLRLGTVRWSVEPKQFTLFICVNFQKKEPDVIPTAGNQKRI